MDSSDRVIVVMPAYNAEKTLEKTYRDIPGEFTDEVILVDDCSQDRTVEIAERLGIEVIRHAQNKGYGGNQKTCYRYALKKGAGIVVMLHPDYQYDPRIIPQLISPIREKKADIMFGSRMIDKRGALRGGMPLYKFISNIVLTALENLVFGLRLSEYHTGFRAYSRRFLENVDFGSCSDGFVFDSEIIAEAVIRGFLIRETSVTTRYLAESSSISLSASLIYGLRTLGVLCKFTRDKWHVKKTVG